MAKTPSKSNYNTTTRSDRQATPTDIKCDQCGWSGQSNHFQKSKKRWKSVGILCDECWEVNNNFIYHMLDLPDHYLETIRKTPIGKRIYSDSPHTRIVKVDGIKMTIAMKRWLLRKAEEYAQHTGTHHRLWAVSLLSKHSEGSNENVPSPMGNRYRLKP